MWGGGDGGGGGGVGKEDEAPDRDGVWSLTRVSCRGYPFIKIVTI